MTGSAAFMIYLIPELNFIREKKKRNFLIREAARPLGGGGVKAGQLRKKNFFEARKKFRN